MQQDEYTTEMKLEAEAQARSAAFLFTNVARYFATPAARSALNGGASNG